MSSDECPDAVPRERPTRSHRSARYFVLSYGRPSDADSVASVQRALDLTIAGWRFWAQTCALPSFADTHVLRSALCLKLHAYEDTGAIIAAATTSLPEALGTRANLGLSVLLAS